ncbi:MAG: MFS transporter [Gordonia sp. (in: high G+C Gram-positive bacteria)]|uniref:MFS transporter n=1 Tax=Gordonia sp. (in: high G+C Gram-positive bacteria) TaxID=84139 RepID=UPI0039E22BEA
MSAPAAQTAKPRLRPYQLVSLLLCMVLNMLDGYDIFIMAFAGPHLPEGFAGDRMLGWLISAALAGQAVGALGMARFADVIGRRRLLLIALTVNTAGLVFSALSVDAWMLLGCRFVTGIAVGMITVVAVVLGQELAPGTAAVSPSDWWWSAIRWAARSPVCPRRRCSNWSAAPGRACSGSARD